MMKFIAAKNKQTLPQEPKSPSEGTPIPKSTKTTANRQDIVPPTKKEIEQMEEIIRLYKNNEIHVEEDEVLDDSSEEIVDESMEEGHDIPDDDKFELLTGGIFEREEVLKIELPKFMIKNDIKNLQVVEDKSTIMLTLAADESNQDIGKRIFSAIKKGFKEFKINLNDFEDDTISVWDFTNAKIRTVDFGSLESVAREEPRTIMCEIEYDDLIIDKEGLY